MPHRFSPLTHSKYVERTLPAIKFIKLLMLHIPEKHFKMIRYYGIYARHRKIDENLHRQCTSKQRHLYASFTRWREAILLAFGYVLFNIMTVK